MPNPTRDITAQASKLAVQWGIKGEPAKAETEAKKPKKLQEPDELGARLLKRIHQQGSRDLMLALAVVREWTERTLAEGFRHFDRETTALVDSTTPWPAGTELRLYVAVKTRRTELLARSHDREDAYIRFLVEEATLAISQETKSAYFKAYPRKPIDIGDKGFQRALKQNLDRGESATLKEMTELQARLRLVTIEQR